MICTLYRDLLKGCKNRKRKKMKYNVLTGIENRCMHKQLCSKNVVQMKLATSILIKSNCIIISNFREFNFHITRDYE